MVNQIIVKTYSGKTLGTISSAGDDLRASTPALQEMVDVALRRAGSAKDAMNELDGWQNGYIFATSDPDVAVPSE